ncbi:MAG: hypothetical protein EOO49_16805 [Flavobacterium sp.]|nr:MAG: hypothetical protein EOO49_16805 [Flavobacterium sp.]
MNLMVHFLPRILRILRISVSLPDSTNRIFTPDNPKKLNAHNELNGSFFCCGLTECRRFPSYFRIPQIEPARSKTNSKKLNALNELNGSFFCRGLADSSDFGFTSGFHKWKLRAAKQTRKNLVPIMNLMVHFFAAATRIRVPNEFNDLIFAADKIYRQRFAFYFPACTDESDTTKKQHPKAKHPPQTFQNNRHSRHGQISIGIPKNYTPKICQIS